MNRLANSSLISVLTALMLAAHAAGAMPPM